MADQFDPFTTPVDYCKIAGVKTPGYAYPKGAALKFRWEEQKGHGFDGSGLTFTGKDLCEFDIIIELYTSAEWKEWQVFLAQVIPSPTPTSAKALEFWHPLTAMLGINSVVIEDVLIPDRVDIRGVWQVVLKVKEYRAATPKPVAKAKGTKTTAARQGTTVVDDPYDAEIRKLTGQVQDLA